MPYNNAGTFADSPLTRVDANTLEQYGGTGSRATQYNLYTNRTDASNYERLQFRYDTGNTTWVIDSNKAGSGTLRRIEFAQAGTTYWAFRTDGQWRGTDNTASTITVGNGSTSAPGYQFGTGGSSTGFFNAGTGGIDVTSGNSHTVKFDNGIFLKSNGSFAFSSTSTPNGSNDIGFSRSAAGVLEINNGTGGTYRDILTRALRSSAVTFANRPGTPVEGMLVAFTDSTTATWGATITGTGSNHVLGYFNGTNWTVAAA
jgi:hypothetical protein